VAHGRDSLSDRRQPPSPATRVAAALACAAYGATNAVLGAAAVILWPRRRPLDAKTICIFRIGNIGDIVCALPAMRALRAAYPDARITLLTSPGPAALPGAIDVLAGENWLDEVKVYHSEDIDTVAKRAALLRELRARRFDLWIDLPNNLTTISRQWRDMAFARMARVRWARGWRIDTLKWAARAQSEVLTFPNEVDRMLAVVRRAGVPVRAVDFGLARTPEATARVDRALAALGGPGAIVAIAPGAKRSTNLWLGDRFAEVGRALAVRGYRIVLLGGTPDRATCERLALLVGPAARSFASELSVAESCELLRRCDLAICVDSGVQHLAAAVGTPVVSLFSFWQMFGKWRPYGAANQVLQKWVPCHTCFADECPRQNLCMARISVADVVGAAERSLARAADQERRRAAASS
jgi:ADP-heptose:LPS heptosyltransferase